MIDTEFFVYLRISGDQLLNQFANRAVDISRQHTGWCCCCCMWNHSDIVHLTFPAMHITSITWQGVQSSTLHKYDQRSTSKDVQNVEYCRRAVDPRSALHTLVFTHVNLCITPDNESINISKHDEDHQLECSRATALLIVAMNIYQTPISALTHTLNEQSAVLFQEQTHWKAYNYQLSLSYTWCNYTCMVAYILILLFLLFYFVIGNHTIKNSTQNMRITQWSDWAGINAAE